jgi:hypothetical protein
MSEIRERYRVPAKRGMTVLIKGTGRLGFIAGASGTELRIRLDGEKRSRRYHPMVLEYLRDEEYGPHTV